VGYRGVNNQTPFNSDITILNDINGKEILVVYVKATYKIVDPHTLALTDEQAPLEMAGAYYGNPGESSLKTAPESCFDKLSTDICMLGHAHAPQGQAVNQLDVMLRVEDIVKAIRVFGDRVWRFVTDNTGHSFTEISVPQPFLTMPLRYEYAFGGKDETPEDEADHEREERNIIGKGIVSENSRSEEFIQLPNLEDPANLIESIEDRPQPACFGPIPGDWQPRRAFAGTYGEEWEKERKPLLPNDFDPKFFNAAHPDLIAPGFLNGYEEVEIINASPMGRLHFRLPGDVPNIVVTLSNKQHIHLETKLDTLTIDTDDHTVQLLWRAGMPISGRMHELYEVHTWIISKLAGNSAA
jgi:hypothetical protein